MTRRWGGAVLGGLLLLATAVAVSGCTVAAAGPRRVEIRIHYSHFDPPTLTVPHGVPITFVLVNEDPIDHEWLIGDAAFHERHRHGTEAHHGARPDEVSIDALSTIETTITLSAPGTLQYICHLPSHEAFGMVGTLTVS